MPESLSLHTNNSKAYYSIVTINYNNWSGLVKTVKSVISQEFKQFEYIIIDGNSNDPSKEYLWDLEDHRIRLISEEDTGIYNAMNKGIRMASGQYIIFLNSGDYFTNINVLQRLQEFNEIHNNRLKFIYGDTFEIETNGQPPIYKKAKSHLTIQRGMFAHHQSMVFSNHIIQKHQLMYDEGYEIAADWDFIIRFLKNISGHEIGYFDSSISNFALGGVSSNYTLGIKEQIQIRQKQFNWNPLKCQIKAFRDLALNTTRALCPWVYRTYTKYRSGAYF